MNENWILNCPPPDGGKVTPGYYNAGTLLADERQGPTDEDCRVQIVTDATEDDFWAYREKLAGLGLTEHQIGWDRFLSFTLDGRCYQVGWFPKRGQLRIIEDPASVPVDQFGYKCTGDKQTVLYQYGLYYDPDNNMTERTANCGMLYIIRLSDNSLFMIDGGLCRQWNEEASDGLWQFLQKITGGNKIRISGWYFTHTHADHIDGCVKLLNRHHEDIQLERIIWNLPHYDVLGSYEDSAFLLKDIVARWYPDILALKPHTGQRFHLADMEIEVLFSHEDGPEPENIARFPFRDGNCMSGILRLTIGGKTLMLLGDTNIETEALLARTSAPAQWKADLVQVAHHCFNSLDMLYEWIAAPAAIVPNSWGGAHQPENEPKLQAVLKYIEDGKIWYEGGGTDGLVPTEDGWVHLEHYDLIGGEYDFSGY